MQTTRWRKNLTLLCPALSSLCLAGGFLPSWAAAAGALTLLIWAAAHRKKTLWTANLGLAAATAAAAYGLATGAGLAWMLPAAALGLASWDLLLLDARLEQNPPGVPTAALERAHFAALVLALGLGLLAAALGQLIRFQIPFFFMLILVALAYVSLDRLLRALGESSK